MTLRRLSKSSDRPCAARKADMKHMNEEGGHVSTGQLGAVYFSLYEDDAMIMVKSILD